MSYIEDRITLEDFVELIPSGTEDEIYKFLSMTVDNTCNRPLYQYSEKTFYEMVLKLVGIENFKNLLEIENLNGYGHNALNVSDGEHLEFLLDFCIENDFCEMWFRKNEDGHTMISRRSSGEHKFIEIVFGKCSPEQIKRFFDSKDNKGNTLLHMFCRSASTKILETILKFVDEQTFGELMAAENNKQGKPLQWAYENKYVRDKKMANILMVSYDGIYRQSFEKEIEDGNFKEVKYFWG